MGKPIGIQYSIEHGYSMKIHFCIGSIAESYYTKYFEDQEIVLRFIKDENSKLYDLLEFIVTEAGGQVSEEISNIFLS